MCGSPQPEHITTLFFTTGSHAVLFFQYQTLWEYSDGKPVTGALNAGMYEKYRDFRLVSRFISETIQGRPSSYHGTPIGTCLCDLSNGTISNDLEWSLTKLSKSRHYLTLNMLWTWISQKRYEIETQLGLRCNSIEYGISNSYTWVCTHPLKVTINETLLMT